VDEGKQSGAEGGFTMTGLKTIVATGVIVCAATAVAFGGVHLGQPTAGASAAPTASPKATKVTYTIRRTDGQLEHLAKLLGGQKATVRAQHHARHETGHDTPVRTVYRQATSAGSTTTHHSETYNGGATICRDSNHICRDSDRTACSHDGGCGDGGGCD
jgi:hypothetical protein